MRRELLGNAAALLWPSRSDGPIDLAPIEANACGTPDIAFLRGPASEVVLHEVNGICRFGRVRGGGSRRPFGRVVASRM